MARWIDPLLDWIKKNGLVAFGIVGSALTIFQGLEPFLRLSRLAVWIVDGWRGIVVKPWVWLGSLIDMHVPPDIASALSLYVFFIAFMSRATIQAWHADDISVSRQRVVSSYLILFVFLVVSTFAILSGPQEGVVFASFLLLILSTVAAMTTVLASAGVFVLAVLAMRDRNTVSGICVAGATNAVRATLLVLGLVCLNWIGIYAPDIKAWIDEATSLSP